MASSTIEFSVPLLFRSTLFLRSSFYFAAPPSPISHLLTLSLSSPPPSSSKSDATHCLHIPGERRTFQTSPALRLLPSRPSLPSLLSRISQSTFLASRNSLSSSCLPESRLGGHRSLSSQLRTMSSESSNQTEPVSEPNSKPVVLLIGSNVHSFESELREFSETVRLPSNASDWCSVLNTNKYAQRIRAVATSSFAGFPSELFALLPSLEIISNFGVGVDSIDVELARKHQVSVTNTPDVLTDDVADLTLAFILCVSRRMCVGDRYVREGRWAKEGFMPLTRKMSGKRVGIIGMGRIGLAIAKRSVAFDCHISYTSRNKKSECPDSYRYYPNAVELAKNCDFLIAACPLTPETEKIVNRRVLDALGPEGVLVNIARGRVVDERELVLALKEGRLGGAGLDVFEDEPNVPEDLLDMEQVVLMPHVGSGTVETRAEMGKVTVANVRAHFDGKPLLTPV